MRLRGLVVDYGGVLTSSATQAFEAFERTEGLPDGTLLEIIAAAYRDAHGSGAVARYETGASTDEEFEQALAAEFRARGHELDTAGVSARMFAASQPVAAMWDALGRARRTGIRTALLSNSWGVGGYPRERFEAAFDAVVISGEVGLRKPDPAIFVLTASRLRLEPAECVFVDDLARNVEGARAVGMRGLVHRTAEQTLAQLSGLLGVDLRTT